MESRPRRETADTSENEPEQRAGELLRTAAFATEQASPVEVDRTVLADARRFATANGIKTTVKDGSLEYRLQANGVDQLLFSTDATGDGVKEAARKLDRLVRTKQEEIEKRYGVEFGKDSEKADKQWILTPETTRQWDTNPDGTLRWLAIPDASLARGAAVSSRPPQLSELIGLEAALKRSEPSYFALDGKHKLKFYFLKEPYIQGDSGDTIATYINRDINGRPAVLIAPNGTTNRPITEVDREKEGLDGEFSIESFLVHEMAHNSQYNLKWDDSENLEKVSAALGWAPFEDTATKATVWVIKGKNDELYRLDKDSFDWILVDANGQPRGKDGKPVKSQKELVRLDATQMRDAALIRPPSDYFDNAVELAAEAFKIFRINEKGRADLLKESPQLYRVIKEQDQLEINKIRGVDRGGEPKFLRGADGILVANTAENRRKVAEFEAGAGVQQ